METASINEIKNELRELTPKQLVELCLQLAKYKKENKELLGYLLFDAEDRLTFIKNVKQEIDDQLKEMNQRSIFLAKKTVRKVLRTTNKYIRYSGSKQNEAELLIYYCKKIKDSGLAIHTSTALTNLYQRQIQRIQKALSTLNEDLQYDYGEELSNLI